MKVRKESKFQIDEEKKLHQEGAEQKFNFSIFFYFSGFRIDTKSTQRKEIHELN